MADKKEPQSYGSQGDWVSGKTSQDVNRQKGKSDSPHADFYEERRESETSAPHQGGDVSPVQAAEHAMPSGPPADKETKATVDEGGAKRGGYFKKRDYDDRK